MGKFMPYPVAEKTFNSTILDLLATLLSFRFSGHAAAITTIFQAVRVHAARTEARSLGVQYE